MQRLDEYFDRIEQSMIDGAALIAQRDPALRHRVRQKCLDGVVLIGAYQLCVHRELFEPLMRDGDEQQRRVARELKVECIALSEQLRESIKGFMASQAPIDWDALVCSVDRFNALVRAHFAKVTALTRSVPVTPARAA